MEDFEQRFTEIFRRLHKEAIVKSTVVVGRYPVVPRVGTVSEAATADEHPSYGEMSFVVVEVIYPDDYPKEERELDGWIPRDSARCLLGMGLGPLCHNTSYRDDAFVVFTPINEEVYGRLPPLEVLKEKQS